MMNYFVEYQRAMGTLRIVGIILAVLFLLAATARVVVHHGGPDAYLGNLEKSPTAHVTQQTLPDGSRRTVVDDPVKRIHAVAIAKGSHVHIDVTQPAHGARHGHDTDEIHAGNIAMIETTDRKNGTEHVTIDTTAGHQLPIGMLFLSSMIIAFVAASLLGGVLSKENDGHLELAWTKPVSRERYALSAFGVDALTIVVSQLLWVGVALIAALLFFVPHVMLEPQAGVRIAISLLGPIAWYAALTGWSASLKRGPGVVIGLGWLFGWLVPAITELLAGSDSPVVAAIHSVLLAVTYLDPLAYLTLHASRSNPASMQVGALHLPIGTACAALAALIVFYLAAAIVQWRRVEA